MVKYPLIVLIFGPISGGGQGTDDAWGCPITRALAPRLHSTTHCEYFGFVEYSTRRVGVSCIAERTLSVLIFAGGKD